MNVDPVEPPRRMPAPLKFRMTLPFACITTLLTPAAIKRPCGFAPLADPSSITLELAVTLPAEVIHSEASGERPPTVLENATLPAPAAISRFFAPLSPPDSVTLPPAVVTVVSPPSVAFPPTANEPPDVV